jgi:5-formyltetrahydrofolate cyclo-ligase
MESPDKSALRYRIRELVRAISVEERQAQSLRLCAAMREESVWRSAKSLLLFAPLPDEPDIAPLLHEAWSAGKLVALPRFDGQTGRYAAGVARNCSELSAGRFGALEPAADCPVISLNQLDLALVPGVAFDIAGRRLGRGKGFYDRLLAEVRGHKCGVAFDAQIVAEVPEELHDVRVNSILTPTRWHLCLRAA